MIQTFIKQLLSSGVLEEARFFGVESLVPQLEAMIQSAQRSRDNVPLTRRDVINALIVTPLNAELRFQGVNLAGSDLSRLDLRFINFKVTIGCPLRMRLYNSHKIKLVAYSKRLSFLLKIGLNQV